MLTILSLINIGQACDDLIIAARILQTKPLIMESLPPYEYVNRENPVQYAEFVLRNTLQAILFNVNQFPYNEMTNRSVSQLNQTIQFAKEAIAENTTIHELIFALRSVLGLRMDVQLIKKDELSN